MNKPTKFQDAVLLALRLIIALIFLFAAYGKWSYLSAGAPGSSAGMINLLKFLIVVEPLGALALISGFLTRWAAKGLSIIMVGAIYFLHFTMGTKFFTLPGALGWDYNLLILGSCLILITFGAGRWSVDKMQNRS